MFLTRDAENISNLLAFIGRHITCDDTTEEVVTDPEIEKLIGGEGMQRFYLIRSKPLGDISLLKYIVDRQIMVKQREELLDLLAQKIECEKKWDSKSTERKMYV